VKVMLGTPRTVRPIVSQILIPILLLVFAGCSSLESKPYVNVGTILNNKYVMRIETNVSAMKSPLETYVRRYFGSIITIAEPGEDSTGILKINFLATTEDALSFYSGSGGSIPYVDSSLLISLEDLDHHVLWSGEYIYKGGWELSGFVNTTPIEAAKYSIKTLADRFAKDVKT